MLDPSARAALPLEIHAHGGCVLGISPAEFLRDYWQKRPLLIRAAIPDFELPLAADDLAGLACEEAVLARLVLHDATRDEWTLRSGPFSEDTFATLPADHWTLLVQDVDKWDMDVAALLDRFRFLPRWRIDDVMVSYAEDGGGVGPHMDQYDVFLVQGSGRRRWQISTDRDASRANRDDTELCQLRDFMPTDEWLLERGDLLYLPPGVPHNGIAIGAGMTFSIGMRAPARAEMLVDFAEYQAASVPEEHRYADPDLAPAADCSEIDAAALNRTRRALGNFAEKIDDPELALWFGEFITRYRSAQIAVPREPALSAAELETALDGGGKLLRHPFSRMAWTRNGNRAMLFAAGQRYAVSVPLARVLASSTLPELPASRLHGSDGRVVLALVNDGHLLLQMPP